MGKTTYKKSWEKDYSWLKAVLDNTFAEFCKQYCKKFKIDGSEVSQVRSHAKTHKKPLDLNQRTFSVVGSSVVLEPKSCLVLTPEDPVIKVEILQDLHCTHQNYSFASVSSDNQRFRLMFCGLGNRKELPAVRNQNKIFNSVWHCAILKTKAHLRL